MPAFIDYYRFIYYRFINARIIAPFAFLIFISATLADDAKQPNVLILFSDDQRADTISALGNSHLNTPNLDRLTREGSVFSRAYCMGANQGAVCVPSRAMLMTGRSLFRIKENLEGQPTWPEAFGKAGYSTFSTGKWHNQGASLLRVFQQGKAIFLGGMADPYRMTIQDRTETEFINKRITGEHAVKLFADAASDFLKAQSGAKPFLCYAAFTLPHDPRIAPPEYHEKFTKNPPPLPPNYMPVHPFNNGEMTIRDEQLAPWPRTPGEVRKQLGDYYASIEYLDAQIGRILDTLKSTGQYDNTMIIFTSDHGLAIGSHGLFGKQNLYDHSMHSPLIMAGPGIPKGKTIDALTYLFDIYPTIGELAGVQAPAGSEGLSLVPVLTGKTKTRRDVIFTSYTKVQRAVRDDRWKLILYPQVNKSQLFDLSADPDEIRDLATDPNHADDLARMIRKLEAIQKDYGDTQPLRTENPKSLEFVLPKQVKGE